METPSCHADNSVLVIVYGRVFTSTLVIILWVQFLAAQLDRAEQFSGIENKEKRTEEKGEGKGGIGEEAG